MIDAIVIPFGGTVFFICLLKRFAPVLALVDRPGGRKCHLGEVPTIGGLAMFLSLSVSDILFLHGSPPGFLMCAFLLVACGACDDRCALSARVRFVVQAAVALAMAVFYGLVIHGLGRIFDGHALALPPLLAYPFTVFCVLGVINAMNMLDGVDGLAGGVAVTALCWFTTLSFLTAQAAQATFLLLLASSTVGFLVFNGRYRWHRRASVFMGDAGSMMLGLALAWFAISITHHRSVGVPVVPPITSVWIVGLPILDTVVVMSKRLLAGRSPFAPGRDHLHHLLLQRKVSDATVTLLMVASSALLGLIGVLGWLFGIPDYYLSYGFVLLGGLYAILHRQLGQVARPAPTPGRIPRPMPPMNVRSIHSPSVHLDRRVSRNHPDRLAEPGRAEKGGRQM